MLLDAVVNKAMLVVSAYLRSHNIHSLSLYRVFSNAVTPCMMRIYCRFPCEIVDSRIYFRGTLE